MITLVTADDQDIVQAGLAVILGHASGIDLVGQARDGHEAVDLAKQLHPDVVMMDIRMPGMNGIDATKIIVSDPDLDTRVLVVTTFDIDDYVYGALEAGAAGFLLKGADEDTLVAAVRSVAAGEGTLDQRITRRVLSEFSRRRRPQSPSPRASNKYTTLTPREFEILELLAKGMSNREIGAELFIELTTVKYHLAQILTKLEVRDRLQAVVQAFETGILTPRQG
ncbi:response regulator transcription factor [Rhodococcus sp. BGS-1C]|jgi:DNA-binding NarL/FixJ family response regulator|uniref:response regulator n=1 Tax=unclassified Rhodococcus (in: high G+C Gram-positive bacteria) TaxID=192944 RepID=UPI0019CFAD53|nr:response regulator transcription factor [Rhodococcus sp. KRD197]